MTRAPLSADAQKLLLEVSRQLITLSVAALGFLTTMLFTTFKGTHYVPSAMVSLFSFLLSAAAGVLTHLAVVAEAMKDKRWLPINYPKSLLQVTWIAFVVALVAFVVFTWANIRQGLQ